MLPSHGTLAGGHTHTQSSVIFWVIKTGGTKNRSGAIVCFEKRKSCCFQNRWNFLFRQKNGGTIPPVPPVSGGQK